MVITPLILVGFLFVVVVAFGILRGFASCLLRVVTVCTAIFLIFLVLRTLVTM